MTDCVHDLGWQLSPLEQLCLNHFYIYHMIFHFIKRRIVGAWKKDIERNPLIQFSFKSEHNFTSIHDFRFKNQLEAIFLETWVII